MGDKNMPYKWDKENQTEESDRYDYYCYRHEEPAIDNR